MPVTGCAHVCSQVLCFQLLWLLYHTLFLLTSAECQGLLLSKESSFSLYFFSILLVLLSFDCITSSVVFRGSTLFCLPSPHPSPLLRVSDQRKQQMQANVSPTVRRREGQPQCLQSIWLACSSHAFAGIFHVDSRGGHILCNLSIGQEGQSLSDSVLLIQCRKI